VVSYALRKLKAHNRNYPTHDLDSASIICALKIGDITCLMEGLRCTMTI